MIMIFDRSYLFTPPKSPSFEEQVLFMKPLLLSKPRTRHPPPTNTNKHTKKLANTTCIYEYAQTQYNHI